MKKSTIHKINIIVFTAIIAVVSPIMLFVPRPDFSETERRPLAAFPKFTLNSLFSGEFTKGLNTYFSDTVPGRDNLADLSAWLKSKMGFSFGGVVYIPSPSPSPRPPDNPPTSQNPPNPAQTTSPVAPNNPEATSSPVAAQTTEWNGVIDEPTQTVDGGAAEYANEGVLIVNGNRALMITGWFFAGDRYAAALNEYNRRLENARVYSMLVPSSIEFYCPQSYMNQFGINQLATINKMYALLEGVTPVNAYTALAERTKEDIFLRTDHHWSPLGAFYAAEQFAQSAGVPFIPLSDYEKVTIPDYVGSMYGFSGRDPRIKNNPEEFIYYKPKNNYSTTYYNTYTGMNPAVPVEGSLFITMPLSDSYSTFMGGDAKITHITTDVKNGRKLAVFKESMGNALIPFFVNSFEEIYVIDIRFFPYNAVNYLTEKGVTDVLFATSMAMANDGNFVGLIEKLLN